MYTCISICSNVLNSNAKFELATIMGIQRLANYVNYNRLPCSLRGAEYRALCCSASQRVAGVPLQFEWAEHCALSCGVLECVGGIR